MKFIFTLIIMVCASITLRAQTATINGTVKNDTGGTLESGVVLLNGKSITHVQKDGKFQINNLSPKTYTISIRSLGYESQSKQIKVTGNEQVQLEFTLPIAYSAINEVVVTASRVAESANEVPASVTFIGSKSLEKQSQINTNLPNILMQKIPGISASEESQNNFIGKLRGRTFLVLVDGIPQSTPLRNGGRDLRTIDVSAIDHIEAINGASAIYGNGATGGIINYITKKPVQNSQLSSTTSFNNILNLSNTNGTYGYNVSELLTGTKGRLDYVLQGKIGRTGVSRSADGNIMSPFYGLGETNSYNALAKIGYNFPNKDRLEIMGNYYRSLQYSKYVGTKGDFGVSPAIGIPSESDIHGGTPYNRTITAKYNTQLGKTSANASIYYDELRSVFEAFNQIYSSNKGIRLNFSTPFALPGNAQLSLIYGADAVKDHTVQKNLLNANITPDMRMTSIAPYLQSKLTLASNWMLKAGLRYENIDLNVGDIPNKKGVIVPGASNSYHALVFNAGAKYIGYSYLQPFASYSQGYSIGDLGLILRNGIPLSAIDAKPVLVENYEMGFSGQYGIFNYQLSGYYSYSQKGTTFSEVSPGVYTTALIPQRIYGAEASIDARATQWLSISGSIGYMNGREDRNNDKKFESKIDNSTISPLKITASTDINITKKLNVMLQMVNIGSRDVFAPVEYNYGKYPISGYTLFDLYSSYKYRNLAFNFSINNLLNANYYPVAAEVRGATNEGRYYIKGQGATATLGISFHFKK